MASRHQTSCARRHRETASWVRRRVVSAGVSVRAAVVQRYVSFGPYGMASVFPVGGKDVRQSCGENRFR